MSINTTGRTDIVAFAPIVENTSTTLYDYSGNARNFSGTGSPVMSGVQSGTRQVKMTRGSTATVYEINNTDGGITGGACTLIAWYRATSLPSTYDTILSQGDAGTNVNNFIMYNNNAGTYRLWFNRQKQSVANQGPYFNVTMTLGVWYHVAYVYDGSNVYGYLNGVLVGGPTAASGNGASGVTDHLGIGVIRGNASSYEYAPDGAISNAMFFNRALTQAEIKAIARNTLIA